MTHRFVTFFEETALKGQFVAREGVLIGEVV